MLKKFILILSSLVSVTALNAAEPVAYIVNGTETSTSSYPSYARLYFYYGEGDSRNYGFCGATILNSSYVVTAAHCVDQDDEDIGEVGLLFTAVVPNLDDEDNISNAEKYYVADFYVHESFDADYFLNDIAVLKLETALNISSGDYVDFADNEAEYRDESETFIAVGHGDTSTGVDSTSILLETTLTYVENSECNYYPGGAPETQLCMEGEEDSSSGLENATCQGDSGGPLYWSDKLVGVTSYGPALGCGTTSSLVNATSVFTEVLDYEAWISQVKLGAIDSSYTTSQSDREYYLENGTLPSSSSSSSGGGGLTYWSVLVLFVSYLIRMLSKPYFQRLTEKSRAC